MGLNEYFEASTPRWWRASNIFVHFHPENLGKMFTHFDGHVFLPGVVQPPTINSQFLPKVTGSCRDFAPQNWRHFPERTLGVQHVAPPGPPYLCLMEPVSWSTTPGPKRRFDSSETCGNSQYWKHWVYPVISFWRGVSQPTPSTEFQQIFFKLGRLTRLMASFWCRCNCFLFNGRCCFSHTCSYSYNFLFLQYFLMFNWRTCAYFFQFFWEKNHRTEEPSPTLQFSFFSGGAIQDAWEDAGAEERCAKTSRKHGSHGCEEDPFTRWFNVTFLSPSWRSLNLQKGHLTIPKRSQWIARLVILFHVFGLFSKIQRNKNDSYTVDKRTVA